MSEKEIRSAIKTICEDLDRGTRDAIGSGVRKVILPSMLGVSLACTGCGERGAVSTDARPADASTEAVPSPDAAYGVPDAIYAAPPPDLRRFDYTPPIPPYMAPDWFPTYDASPRPPKLDAMAPLYAAPGVDSSGGEIDAGDPLYGAPPPDSGSSALYAAPDPDGGN